MDLLSEIAYGNRALVVTLYGKTAEGELVPVLVDSEGHVLVKVIEEAP